jgi:hypothetical protein
MPKKSKAMVRLYKGPENIRNLWKQSFIQAALAADEFRKAKHKGE